jgi:cell division protein FtsL
MSEHENIFLQEFEKVLQKQYSKYIVSAIVFVVIFIPSTYFSVRIAIDNHETRIQQCEKELTKQSDRITKLDDKLYTHISIK